MSVNEWFVRLFSYIWVLLRNRPINWSLDWFIDRDLFENKADTGWIMLTFLSVSSLFPTERDASISATVALTQKLESYKFQWLVHTAREAQKCEQSIEIAHLTWVGPTINAKLRLSTRQPNLVILILFFYSVRSKVMKLEVRTDPRASIWMALLGTRGRNGHLRIFIMFYLFSIFFYVILCRTREFLYIEYRITLVELTLVYPFFLLPAFLMYVFIYFALSC